VEITLEQTSTEYEVAKRSERRKVKEEKKEAKGQPSSPGIDPELEPLRKAMQGKGAVVVGVEREDEILACVDAFEGAGIKPILLGAKDAWKVAEKIRGRVAGVLLDQEVVSIDPKTGSRRRNRYAEIVSAGIPIAFHSDAEEGAVDLPTIAAYAVSQGMGPEAALRALTSDAAKMYAMQERVGRLAPGCDGDVALLDGNPLDLTTRVLRVWAGGEEVR
jgi:imidazolonepropionase-like amidohydrolase